jgi:hypothetical protein
LTLPNEAIITTKGSNFCEARERIKKKEKNNQSNLCNLWEKIQIRMAREASTNGL